MRQIVHGRDACVELRVQRPFLLKEHESLQNPAD